MNDEREKPDPRPLYEQVREILVRRIQTGAWAPGAALPNEFQIAAELGVSQGTARKALNEMAGEQLIVRRQGLGTFVAEHTAADVLFRFFQFRDEAGNRIQPQSTNRVTRRGRATRLEADRLSLERSAPVIRHGRTRTLEGRPFIIETIVLSEARFRDLGTKRELPNTLYDLFQKEYGVTVARADEKILVKAATATEAKALDVAPGTPLLKIERVAISIDEQPIEWRVSLCHLEGVHYAVRLR